MKLERHSVLNIHLAFTTLEITMVKNGIVVLWGKRSTSSA
jgi:hypothetical protein